jgi:hypothetical protein
MRRDACGMLFWALRWHEGRRVSWRVLSDVLWGDFGREPEDPVGSIRELMAIARQRYADQWIIQDREGKDYRITRVIAADYRRNEAQPAGRRDRRSADCGGLPRTRRREPQSPATI